jgi:hypothetical protein
MASRTLNVPAKSPVGPNLIFSKVTLKSRRPVRRQTPWPGPCPGWVDSRKIPPPPNVLKVRNGGIGAPIGITKTRQLVSNSGTVVPPGASVLLWLKAVSTSAPIARLVVATSRCLFIVIVVSFRPKLSTLFRDSRPLTARRVSRTRTLRRWKQTPPGLIKIPAALSWLAPSVPAKIDSARFQAASALGSLAGPVKCREALEGSHQIEVVQPRAFPRWLRHTEAVVGAACNLSCHRPTFASSVSSSAAR